jgi:hypothetical protein
MNVEIGAEAALFPEKEYIKGIFVAVRFFSVISAGAKKSRYVKKRGEDKNRKTFKETV